MSRPCPDCLGALFSGIFGLKGGGVSLARIGLEHFFLENPKILNFGGVKKIAKIGKNVEKVLHDCPD